MSLESPLLRGVVEDAYEDALAHTEGEVATYIPALGKADPDKFGIALRSVTGNEFHIGDADEQFTIQSVSKPFSLVLALEYGPDSVFHRLDTEPSGAAFNSIQLNTRGMPFNPMINAGAIAVAGILYDHWGAAAKDELLDAFSTLAGQPLGWDREVYESELETGDRNLAIAHLLRSNGIIGDVEAAFELHTFACSILVTARVLATMSATLANVGRNPVTGEVVADQTAVRHTLSLVATCGMYDDSGTWMLEVGCPAKSGVSGDLIVIVNRQLGIGFWSPRLDEHGNSVRSMVACRDLSAEFDLHTFAASNLGSGVLQAFMSRK
jgi:glutaminase